MVSNIENSLNKLKQKFLFLDDLGLITQAILLGNIDAAIELCLNNKKYTDAVILSMAGGSDLLAQTMNKYFSEHTGALNSLINSLVSKDWMDIVKKCDISCWKEVLVGIFVHANIEERNILCGNYYKNVLK